MSDEDDQKQAAAQEESLFRAIEEKKKEDPLIGLKIGSEEINKRVFDAFQTEQGINVNMVLKVISAMAGFACQMAIREAVVDTGKVKEEEAFIKVETEDGGTYYMGGLLNKPLVEDQLSVWALVGGGIQAAGGELPSLEGIAEHGAKTLGGEDFGKPRIPEEHIVGEPPQVYLKDVWPALKPILDKFCDTPVERPILLGICLNKIIAQAKDVIDPKIAGILCMDTATAMSKMDPKALGA